MLGRIKYRTAKSHRIHERNIGAMFVCWIQDLEFELWNAALTGPRKFGHDFITAEDLTFLIEQSKKAILG